MSQGIARFPSQIRLSGADCFFLAMEQHYERNGNTGNVCHLVISPEATITKELLEKKIVEFPVFEWLSKIELDRGFFFGLPKWIYNPEKKSEIKILELTTNSDILPEEVYRNGIFLKDPCLFRFTLLHKPGGKVDLVFSWHHILMDAQGAETLLKLMGGEIKEEKVKYFPDPEKYINPIKSFITMHFSKEFIKKSSKKPLVQIVTKTPDYNPVTRYRVLEFTEEETRQLDKRALENGAGVSKGSFYLASTTKVLNEWLTSKGNTKGTFWIPTPQNRRPRGTYGPVISNLQGFMFYRIPREKTSDLKNLTKFITSEMFDLIRRKIPDDYAVMSNLLRGLPSGFYYWLIKGPAGGSVASFLYTDPGVNEFKTFLGQSVKNITNYPPGTFPPGFMTVYERFNGKQKIIINYTEQIVSPEDLSILERKLRKELLGTDETGNHSM